MKKPSPTARDIARAKRNAVTAKARVQTSVGALKQRLAPSALAAEAAQGVRSKTSKVADQVSQTARERPAAASAVAGAAALILLRKPLGRLAARLFSRKEREARRERKETRRAERDARKAEKQARRESRSDPSPPPAVEPQGNTQPAAAQVSAA